MAAKEDAKYALGRMKREAERLQKQHAWHQACLQGQIVFAAVDLEKPGLKVLDVGCAEGSLLRDLQKQVSPSAQLFGVDLTAAFLPESPQGNIRYAVGNVCDPPPAEHVRAFDLTHVRSLLVGCGSVSIDNPVSNLVATLSPGAWLQVQELDVLHPTPGTAHGDLLRILAAIWNKTGPGAAIVNDLGDAFVRAGLTNVEVRRVQLPVGKKMGNERDARDSLEPFKLAVPNISNGAKAMGLDLPASVFDNLAERFEQEMLEQGAVFGNVLVYGQKPL
ncbi:hypothetical protein NA57DRAFT_72312 [Rhizodiscina lignyota]|uniref:Methyltransferase domain-containing protein n=1 Tax=Rhizodiscina lignyota TaxID=1504668 RepID=A0A9P4IS92_9PEZI|nr:hypothetical protein NA57DRAFT_72312 [Rhizodiscina lignyota]